VTVIFVIENGLGLGYLGLGLNCDGLRSSRILLISDGFWKIVTKVDPWRLIHDDIWNRHRCHIVTVFRWSVTKIFRHELTGFL
jgi:hypothetical protein